LKRIFTRRSDARRLALLGIVTGSVVAASAAAQEKEARHRSSWRGDRENPFDQTINLPLVEDVTIEWPEALSPFVTVAKLRIPQQDISGDDNLEKMDALSFTPGG
jgi:hypothetical protein